jgi:hypothetical protein
MARPDSSIKQRSAESEMTGSMDAAPGMISKDGHAAATDVVYLHGVLEATVFEADHLHNAIHGRIIKVNDRYVLGCSSVTCSDLLSLFMKLFKRKSVHEGK